MIEKALLGITVALAVYAQLVWKARALIHAPRAHEEMAAYIAAMLGDPWIWTGLASTALGMVTWMLVLRRLELSVAYSAMAAVFLFVPVGAHLLFGEGLSPTRITGLGLIVIGILVVAHTA